MTIGFDQPLYILRFDEREALMRIPPKRRVAFLAHA